jgi:hypothetical protein
MQAAPAGPASTLGTSWASGQGFEAEGLPELAWLGGRRVAQPEADWLEEGACLDVPEQQPAWLGQNRGRGLGAPEQQRPAWLGGISASIAQPVEGLTWLESGTGHEAMPGRADDGAGDFLSFPAARPGEDQGWLGQRGSDGLPASSGLPTYLHLPTAGVSYTGTASASAAGAAQGSWRLDGHSAGTVPGGRACNWVGHGLDSSGKNPLAWLK